MFSKIYTQQPFGVQKNMCVAKNTRPNRKNKKNIPSVPDFLVLLIGNIWFNSALN